MMKYIILLISLVSIASAGILSNVFGSNMVLQRAPISASLYGWTVQGDTITVAISSGKKYQTTAGVNGTWTVSLDPVEAGGPYVINVVSAKVPSGAVTLNNILFGDVILCGGQSNMQFTVNGAFNASQAFDDAGNYTTIRIFTVGQATSSNTPLNELGTIEQEWSVVNRTTLGETTAAFNYFSAVCWFTAVNIQKSFPNLPLGLISSNWGGTLIESWSSPDALAECPQSSSSSARKITNKVAQSPMLYASKQFQEDSQIGMSAGVDSQLWNAMIVPFIPMRLAAFLWYQAEANVGETDLYRCLFPAMVNDWRVKWGQGDIPFIFAQLAPYTTDGPLPFPYSLPDMRLAQTSALVLPKVALVSTIDLGDTGSPWTNIHPRNKQTVGYRMSLAALYMLYNIPYVYYSGPTLSSATISSPAPNVEIILNFLPNTIGEGLILLPASCPVNLTFCSTWEIGFSDGTWVVGSASIVNDVAVKVFPATTPLPTTAPVSAVRYLYSDWPVAPLYSKSGLPASPFYFIFVP